MKKTLITIAVLYGIAALGTPYLIGDKIQTNTEHFFNNAALKQQLGMQGITLELKHYNKGYFTSNADISISIHDPISGKNLYSSDIDADITHAPFTLSGLNAAKITLTGANKPGGEIGRHLPQDFISAHLSESLIALLSGKHSIDANINLAPFTTTIADEYSTGDDQLDFQGADINLDDAHGFAARFKGLTITNATAREYFEAKPFNITTESDGDTKATAKVDKLHFIGNKGDSKTIDFELSGLRETLTFIKTDSEELPLVPSAIGIAFKQWHINAKESQETGGMQIEDGLFQIGFVPDGDNYALTLALQAKPTFTGKLAEEIPDAPTDIDINLHIAPFSHTILTERLPALFIAAANNPDAISQQLPGIILDNAGKEHVVADINAVIDDKSGKLFTAKGAIHEHLKGEADLINIMFDPRNSIPTYFHGSKMDLFLSKTTINAYLDYLTRVTRTGNHTPPPEIAPYLTGDGSMALNIDITDKQILLNGKAI